MSDAILVWNGVALEANRVSHTNGQDEQTGPTGSARALAITHLAMYDAYAGIANDPGGLPRYLPAPPPPAGGAAAAAAVAAAAHTTLSALFPSQRPFFDLMLAGAGDPADPGHAFGVAVGHAHLAERAGDPGGGSTGYAPSLERGRHRPDPENPGQGFHGAYYGARCRGFAVTQRFELAPPPFDDTEYLRAVREVRGRGVAPDRMGTVPQSLKRRTTDQTLVGVFWAYDGVAEVGTPPRLYNQITRTVASARGNTEAENARLFAFVNAAMADAAMLAWDQKYIHDLWRPVLGIREHDRSMGWVGADATDNPSDDADPEWLPYGAPRTNRIGKNFTPPFPAYPSGHATFGAAAFHILRLFYGVPSGDRGPDDLCDGVTFVSDELNGRSSDHAGTVRPRHVRRFPRGLWQMIEENGRSRVYLGVHWVFDAFAVHADGTPDLDRTDAQGRYFGGVPLGLQIAEDIFAAGAGKAPVKSGVMPRP